MIIDAVRVKDGVRVELHVTRPVKFGAVVVQRGVRYRRVASAPSFTLGAFGPRQFRDGIVMYSEPLKGCGGPGFREYTTVPGGGDDLYGLARNQNDIDEYVAASKDTNRPVEWTR